MAGGHKFHYSQKIACENKYWGLRHPSVYPTSSAIAILFVIILVEIIVHTSIASDCNHTEAQDEDDTLVGPSSPVDEQLRSASVAQEDIEKQTLRTSKPKRTLVWCSPAPSRGTRAVRLVLAGCVLYPAFTAMYTQIQSAKEKHYIDPVCARHVHPPKFNWAPIIVFNIIPFALGACAFLRALIDFVLGFFGMGLSYTRKWRAFPWMPCMPLFLVGVLLYGAFRGVRWSVAWVFEKVNGERKAVEGVDEERKGLVGESDEDSEESGESTAYEMDSPKTSSEGGKKGEKIV